ncbi:MAG: hypothetical protein RDV48_22515 [Candidatus Eremiobacteraeota bacterium]|nr:hypothetical protein [Candidatus Eremiobacteraeota bacterium]
MFDNRISERAPLTAPFGHGASTVDERKEIRGQRIEESLMAPVAAPGAEQVQELSSFYNKILDSIDQLRYPCAFPALDEKGGSEATASPLSSIGTSTSPSDVKRVTGKEAQKPADEIKNYVQGEIDRLIQKDGTKGDLDKRTGHVQMDYVEGDGYKATLNYDPHTRKALHMESQIDGGRTWKYGYDRGNASTPETYSRETISPLTPEKEGDETNGSVYHHLKQTILNNKDGTVSMREEESIKPDEESN